MAHADDVERAKQGKDVWNAWAKEQARHYKYPPADFSGQRITFSLAGFHFPGPVSFAESTFASGAQFESATFDGRANFTRAKFHQITIITKAQFHGTVDFDGATSERDFFLLGTTFRDSASFESMSFGGPLYAIDTKFVANVEFFRAHFKDNADFSASQFDAEADFRQTNFDRMASFSGVRFRKEVFFAHATFGGPPANFNDTKFSTLPDLRAVIVRSPPTLTGTEIGYESYQGNWFIHRLFRFASSDEDAARFRRLKQFALETRDHDRELEFFANELRAKRFHETRGFWPIALNVSYDWLSRYGTSISRPTLWLLSLTVVAFGAIAMGQWKVLLTLADWSTLKAFITSMLACATVATTNIPLLIGADKWVLRSDAFQALGLGKDGSLGLVGGLLAYGQSAASLVLLFLIGLGLRNRFKVSGNG